MDEETKKGVLSESILKHGTPDVTVVQCGDFEVRVRSDIPMRDYAEIVENVCAACFDDEGNYRPYVRNYMLNIEMLRKYTDIDMPDDLDKCLEIVDILNTHFNDSHDTWMDAICYAAFSSWNELCADIKARVQFELNKYERDTHEMVQRMSNTVRSFGLLLEEALDKLPTEGDAAAEPAVADDGSKIISMPVSDNGD